MSWERRKATIKGGSTNAEEEKLNDWTRVGLWRKRWRRVRVRRRWNWERKRSLEGWARLGGRKEEGTGGREGGREKVSSSEKRDQREGRVTGRTHSPVTEFVSCRIRRS